MGRITKLRKSNDYVEMIRWIINVDEVERYMMKKGWTGNKNLDRMGFRKEIYKMVGKEMIWRVKELWDTFLDGVDFEEYEKDKKRRLGEEAVNPHRMRFKKLER